jgi:hypothetical protein
MRETLLWLAAAFAALLAVLRWSSLAVGLVGAWTSRLPGMPQEAYSQVVIGFGVSLALAWLLGFCAEIIIVLACIAGKNALSTWWSCVDARMTA